MNVEKLIKMIKISDYTKYIMSMYNIYSHMSYLQQIAYICSKNDMHKENNIKCIVNDICNCGYKIDECSEYNELIMNIEKIKSSINSEVVNYTKNRVNDETEEEMIKKLFNM